MIDQFAATRKSLVGTSRHFAALRGLGSDQSDSGH
jgi:hypothetical protein